MRKLIQPAFNFHSVLFQQKGVALITVMLVVALAAIIASQMTARLQVQIQRTTNIQLNQQAYWYAMGAEAFTKRILLMSAKDEGEVTHLEQPWAMEYSSFPVEHGQISGEIKDLQSCLNLNGLRAPATENQNTNGKPPKNLARIALERLIVALNIDDVSEFEAEAMADSLSDWLDSDDDISGIGGAEDNDYASKEFPYLAANHYIASVNELRLVEHFTVPVIQGLKPYVCVIPNDDTFKININTLDSEKPELLKALLDIATEDAVNILSAIPSDGFKDITEFYNLPELLAVKMTDEQKKQFVVDSEYFTLNTTASFNDSFFTLNSIFKLINNKEIYVVSRTIGRL